MVDENKNFKHSLIFVVGTTASGKSDLALSLAQKTNGVIVNCDSVQIYKDLKIGSAQPNLDQMKMVPHFLYGSVEAPHVVTTGDYYRLFHSELEKISVDKPVFVVGGTGFYFQALEKGMLPIPPAEPLLRQELEAQVLSADGAQELFGELKSKDPVSAEKISPNDHYRLVRAIEVMRTVGKPWSQIKNEFSHKETTKKILKIGTQLEKKILHERIHLRVFKMIECGWIEEVQDLLDKGLQDWAPLNSIGYKEVVEHLRIRNSKSELIEKITISTRQLSKRQRTWFQRDKDIIWFDGHQGLEMQLDRISEFMREC